MLKLKKIIPVHIRDSKLAPIKVNGLEINLPISLLIISDPSNNNYHYVLIKNFQSFTSEQFRNGNGYFHTCERCFNHTTSESMRIKHNRLCVKNELAKMKMPSIIKKPIKMMMVK